MPPFWSVLFQFPPDKSQRALQTTALAMQEQERLAGEEAEKRLKAALTAKREPGVTASRLASPAGGNPSTLESSDPKPASTEESETPMEIDLTNTTPTQKDDVILFYLRSVLRSLYLLARGIGFLNFLLYLKMSRHLHPEMFTMLLGKYSLMEDLSVNG